MTKKHPPYISKLILHGYATFPPKIAEEIEKAFIEANEKLGDIPVIGQSLVSVACAVVVAAATDRMKTDPYDGDK